MTFERVGSTPISMSSTVSASIDKVNGFAYFAAYNSKTVSKVSLSSFTEVATISHSSWNFYNNASVIDTQNGFLYLGVASAIDKIRLSDFTLVDSLTIPESHVYGAAIDETNGFAYFTKYASIIRVNLSNFTSTTLVPGGTNFYCIVIDTVNGFAYIGTFTATGSVIKIRLSDFSYVATLNITASRLHAAVLDEVNGFAYFASYANQKISKIRLSDFSEVAVLDTPGFTVFRSAVIDSASGYAYFGDEITPANVVKVRLSDFTIADSITFPGGEDNAVCAVIDAANAFIYFGVVGNVVKLLDTDLVPPTTNITGRSLFSSRGASVSGGISAGKGKRRRRNF